MDAGLVYTWLQLGNARAAGTAEGEEDWSMWGGDLSMMCVYISHTGVRVVLQLHNSYTASIGASTALSQRCKP